jgi:hypothetical protein
VTSQTNYSPPAGPLVQDRAGLILKANQPQVLTPRVEGDVRTCIARGLRDYVQSLSVVGLPGKTFKLKYVILQWAEAEVEAKYPSGVVTTGSVVFDDSRMTPALSRTKVSDDLWVGFTAEATLDLRLIIHSTELQERSALAKMIEDGLNPTDWMYGVRLMLPYYHGVYADYSLESADFEDNAQDAQSRARRSVFNVSARAPVVRMYSRTQALPPRFALTVTDSDSPGTT